MINKLMQWHSERGRVLDLLALDPQPMFPSPFKAFNNTSDDEMEKLRVKIDIAYFVAIKNLALTKYPGRLAMEFEWVLHTSTRMREKR